jgi:hypothetical protein
MKTDWFSSISLVRSVFQSMVLSSLLPSLSMWDFPSHPLWGTIDFVDVNTLDLQLCAQEYAKLDVHFCTIVGQQNKVNKPGNSCYFVSGIVQNTC